ncbi:hypothetical protein LTR15_002128 [Elasticomyces elasticus]|nr:hypothetical protein LTR15_002128 [Elasticomyces elasticus]
MKFIATTLAVAGFAAFAAAQGPTYNETDGTFTCPPEGANGAYCAGANIIIRCTNGVGQPGNCNDNLAGYPPIGVNYSPCWSCGANSSRSACSKSGLVQPGSGAGLGNVSFSVNDTSICAAPGPSPAPVPAPAPYPSNGTTPGGPIGANTTTPVSPSGSGAPVSSGSAVPVPYTGGATSVQVMSVGALTVLGAVFAALL